MPMHCLRCGSQLNPEAKEPLCYFCKSEVAKEMILEDPARALRTALGVLSEELNTLKTQIETLKKDINTIKQKA
jgi:cell division protein FtsB